MDKKAALITILLLASGAAFFVYYNRKKSTIVLPPVDPRINPISQILQQNELLVKSMNNAGIRNNNPLNIKWTVNSRRDPWEGQTGESGNFVVFSSPIYGFRAAAKILNTYLSRGNNTIAGIVKSWAPDSDNNDTRAYINFVAKKMGRTEISPISKTDYPAILAAMSKMETGKDWLTADILKGIRLAG